CESCDGEPRSRSRHDPRGHAHSRGMKQSAGPSAFRLLVELPSLRRDVLGRLVDWRARYGDVIRVPLTRPSLYQLSHPDDIKHVLATNALNYDKGGGLAHADLVLGSGLLTSHEPLHTQQRRIMQPAFQRERITSFVQLMGDVAGERLAAWKDGQVLDVPSEMTRLTLAIIGRAMLGSDLSRGADLVGETLLSCMRYLQGDSVFRLPNW